MSDYRILISGSRVWEDRQVIEAAIVAALDSHAFAVKGPRYTRTVVVHGGAPGADTIAGDIAQQRGMVVEVHPADWDAHGLAAGPKRNGHMVGLGANVLLAFPIGRSPGTRNTMRLAERAGIPVIDHDPALTTSPQVREWLADADSRLDLPSVPDDPAEVQRRINELKETT